MKIVEICKVFVRPDAIWFHPANGEKRHIADAVRLKLMGVKPGVSDLVIMHVALGVLFMEIKPDGGRLSKVQEAFRDEAIAKGFDYVVVRSPEEAFRELAERDFIITREGENTDEHS